MNWLTEEEVKRESTTPDSALDVSIKHHQQIYDATMGEIKDCPYKATLLQNWVCGLCRHYGNNNLNCPLYIKQGTCCHGGTIWGEVERAYEKWRERKYHWSRSHEFWQKFKKAELEMLNLLKSLKGNKMDKKEKVTQTIERLQSDLDRAKAELEDLAETYSIADRFKHDNGDKYMIVIDRNKNVSMVSLGFGCAYSSSSGVIDEDKITKAEFGKIISENFYCFTRYYDHQNRKKVNV